MRLILQTIWLSVCLYGVLKAKWWTNSVPTNDPNNDWSASTYLLYFSARRNYRSNKNLLMLDNISQRLRGITSEFYIH